MATSRHWEEEWREEAARLKALPRAVQCQVIAIHRRTANDPRATRADRRTARKRAEALEKFLGLSKRPLNVLRRGLEAGKAPVSHV